MNLKQVNKAISKLNPYVDKLELRRLTTIRRKLECTKKYYSDLPAMLIRQSGV